MSLLVGYWRNRRVSQSIRQSHSLTSPSGFNQSVNQPTNQCVYAIQSWMLRQASPLPGTELHAKQALAAKAILFGMFGSLHCLTLNLSIIHCVTVFLTWSSMCAAFLLATRFFRGYFGCWNGRASPQGLCAQALRERAHWNGKGGQFPNLHL